MSGYLNCAECPGKFKTLYNDPRTPPLDVGPCLCHSCTDVAFDEVIELAEDELTSVQAEQARHHKFK